MRMSHFFRSSWLAQLVVGVGLFLCSFFLEYKILAEFVAPQLLALFLAVTLETGKVTAVVWHYYLNHFSTHCYPLTVRLVSTLFRGGLLVLSLLCSQLFLAAQLDRPNLEVVRAAELRQLTQRFAIEKAEQDRMAKERRGNLIAGQKAERVESTELLNKRIEKLETLLLAEMDNTVNGWFKGRRYAELERRLSEEKERRKSQLGQLNERHQSERTILEQEGITRESGQWYGNICWRSLSKDLSTGDRRSGWFWRPGFIPFARPATMSWLPARPIYASNGWNISERCIGG